MVRVVFDTFLASSRRKREGGVGLIKESVVVCNTIKII